MTCAGPDDKQISLGDDPNLEMSSKDEVQRILLPPQIQTKGCQMNIKLYRAERLVEMDKIGTIDPYIIFAFGSSQFKTPKFDNQTDPVWNCAIDVTQQHFLNLIIE